MTLRDFFAGIATRVLRLRGKEELIVQSLNSKSLKNTAIRDSRQKKFSKIIESPPEALSNGKKNTNNIVDAKTNN